MNDGGLRCIVRRLMSRDVDDVARHARCCNKAAGFEIFELSPMQCSSLLLLSAEVTPSNMGAVDKSVGVDVHDFKVSRNVRVDKRLIPPGNARICHEDVKAPVEFFDSVFHRHLHFVV